MRYLVTKYSAGFPKHIAQEGVRIPSQETVLVTGTTGGLGTSLLARLVQSTDVAKIYAVNRKSDTSLIERQKLVLQQRGYDADIVNSPKVVLLEANLSETELGFPKTLYQEVRNTSVSQMLSLSMNYLDL